MHLKLGSKRSSLYSCPYFTLGKQPVYQTYHKLKHTSICVFISSKISVVVSLFSSKHNKKQ